MHAVNGNYAPWRYYWIEDVAKYTDGLHYALKIQKNWENDVSVDGIKCLLEVDESDGERRLVTSKGVYNPLHGVYLLRATSAMKESRLVFPLYVHKIGMLSDSQRYLVVCIPLQQ